MSAADAAGCFTVAPLALGSRFIVASAWAVSRAASVPALVTSVRALPSPSRSSATSRWRGSTALWPPVVALSCAASMASRARVVNFSAPNVLMGVCSLSSCGCFHQAQRSQS